MTRARSTAVLSALMVVIGLAILVRTFQVGVGAVGLLLGCLFVLAGALRLYLTLR
jgi:hypothetical protein